MKMKYIVAGYTVVVVLLLCFIHVEMTRENQFDVDMVYYNRQLKQVEAELEAASDNIRDIEDKYDCKILLIDDVDYGQRLNTLISEGAVILDYFRDNELTGKVAWEMSKNRYE